MSEFPEFPLPFGNFNQQDPNVKFWTFVVYTWVVAIISLFYFFYLSRAVGQIAGKLLCIYTWRKYKAYVEIESLQFSPLSGKLLFRNLRYYSRNQSIHILRGYVTFRWWLARVRREGDAAEFSTHELPSRFMVRLDGLEWFIYNRTPAYQHLQTVLERTAGVSGNGSPPAHSPENVTVRMSDELPCAQEKDMGFRWFFPIDIVSSTGAITMGLPDLPTILVMHYKEASGNYEIVKSRSVYDYYRTDLNLSLKKVKLTMGPNVDYREPVLNHAARTRARNVRKPWYRKLSAFLRGGIIFGDVQEADIPLQEAEQHWAGLSRYKIVNVPLLKRRRFEEYAQVNKVLECGRLDIRYYADVAGPAPSIAVPKVQTSMDALNASEDFDVGNGDLPPEWGADVTILDGTIHYGPWADRQRGMIQSFFFPTAYRNAIKTESLRPGETRLFVALKILLKFAGKTTLRIPFREASKDWKFYDDALADDENTNMKRGTAGRPYAWIDLKLASRSTVDVVVPFVQSEKGYAMSVTAVLSELTITSSLNYSPLLVANHLKLEIHMHNPLQWNAPRPWNVGITVNSSRVFLLRDHVTLLMDLSKDWSSGPPTPQTYFVPIEYKIKTVFNDFELLLCTNQHNIINQPNDLNDNTYIIINGSRMRLDVTMPFLQFEAESTAVDFQIEARKLRLRMSFPQSHTIGAFLAEKDREIGVVGQFGIDGNYLYHRAFDPRSVDSLIMNIETSGVQATMFGFLISHVLFLKENYMGDHNSFITSDEYRSRLADPIKTETNSLKQEAAREKSNLFEAHIVGRFRELVAILPANLYCIDNVTIMKIAEIQVENRNTTHYNDLQVTFRPVQVLRGVAKDGDYHPYPDSTRNALHIQDITIRGHRLFGLPPKALVYAVDWRISCGDIAGDLQPTALSALQSSLKSFVFHYADVDNSLAGSVALPDVTTILVTVGSVQVSVIGPGSVSTLALPKGLRLQYDNYACQTWVGRTFIEVPAIALRCLANTSDQDSLGTAADGGVWVEVFKLTTAMSMCNYDQIPDWEDLQKLQMAFVKSQDEPTKRCTFLYENPEVHQRGATRRQANRTNEPDKWLPFLPKFNPPFQLSHRHKPRDETHFRFPADGHLQEEVSSYINQDAESTSSESSGSDEDPDEWESLGNESIAAEQGGSFADLPPPRSIPYRTYLKQFRIDRGNKRSPMSFSGTERPAFTGFTQIGISETREDEHGNVFEEKAFHRSLRKYRDDSTDIPRHQGTDGKRSDMTVDLCEAVRITVTPIALRIVQEALEAVKDQTVTSETVLDRITLEHTSYLMRQFPYLLASTAVFVSTPSVHIHCVQDMLLPDATSFVAQSHTARYELSDELLCSFDFVVSGLTATMAQTVDYSPPQSHDGRLARFKFAVNVDRCTTRLYFVGNMNVNGVVGIPKQKQLNKSLPNDSLEGVPVALDLLAEKIQWSGRMERGRTGATFDDGMSLELNTKELSVVSINETIEIMFGVLYKWVTFGIDIGKIHGAFSLRRRRDLQNLLVQIAGKAHSHAVDEDPLFLTQPSSIWVLGSRKHQEDRGWKLLCHMRYSLRSLPPQIRAGVESILNARNDQTMDSKLLFVTVSKHLTSWRRWEGTDVSSVPLLRKLYGMKPMPSLQAQNLAEVTLSRLIWNVKGIVDVSRLNVTIFEYQMEDTSIVVGPILISAQTLEGSNPQEMTAITPGQPAPSSAILDIRYRAKIGRLDCIVNPNLFGFVRHFLRVHRWFQSRLESLVPPIKPNFGSSSESLPSGDSLFSHVQQFVIFGTLLINKISLTAAAHNLVAKASLRSFQLSTLHITPGSGQNAVTEMRAFPLPRHGTGSLPDGPLEVTHSSLGSISTVDITMSEKQSRGASAANASTLISIGSEDIGGMFTRNSSNKDILMSNTGEEPDQTSATINIRHIRVDLPRSLLKLHAFIEKWSDEDLPRYDFLFNSLIKERVTASDSRIGQLPKAPSTSVIPDKHGSPKPSVMRISFLLQHLSVQSDLLASLNFIYEGHRLFVSVAQSSRLSMIDPRLAFSARPWMDWEAGIGAHTANFVSKPLDGLDDTGGASNSPQQATAFALPALRSVGLIRHMALTSGISMPREQQSRNSIAIIGDSMQIEASVELDCIQASVNVNLIDQLITTQSVLGGELNDILDIIAFYARKRKRKRKQHSLKKNVSETSIGRTKYYYALRFRIQGLRVSAHSPNSVVMLESDDISGFAMNFAQKELSKEIPETVSFTNPDKVFWRLSLRGFSFALLRNGSEWQTWTSGGSRIKFQPQVYIVTSVTTQNFIPKDSIPSEIVELESEAKILCVRVQHLHAVFQTTAVTAVTDVVQYYRRELEKGSHRNAKELAKAKENTERLIKGMKMPLPQKHKKESFLKERVIQIQVRNVGAALPLRPSGQSPGGNQSTAARVLSTRRSTVSSGSTDGSPALLVSASMIHLDSKQLRSASGKISDLCFQFVPVLDVSNERHFSPAAHPTANRILLKQTSAEIIRRKENGKSHIQIISGIKGFELEVDSGITEYANQLNVVYMSERGKVVSFMPDASTSAQQNVSGNGEMNSEPGLSTPNATTDLPVNSDAELEDGVFSDIATVVDFDARFDFETGTCKIWSARHRGKTSSTASPPVSTSHLSSGGGSQRTGEAGSAEDPCIHLLALPGITLSTIGNTIKRDFDPQDEMASPSKKIHIELIIHASKNVLHPEILQFIREITTNLKVGRMLKHEERIATGMESSTSIVAGPTNMEAQPNAMLASYQRHSVTFNLCLSHTRISLTCQPTSKVSFNFNLDEADFIFSFIPKAERPDKTQYLSCTGNVLGASGALRHVFSPEDCLNAEIARVTFNITTMERKLNRIYTLEIGVPSLMGSLNARHLQDFFLFKRMWVDSWNFFPRSASTVRKSFGGLNNVERRTYGSSLLSLVGENGASLFDTINVAARLNQIEFAMDFGQAIGKGSLTLDNLVVMGSGMRSALGFEEKEVCINFETLSLKTEGKFSGATTVAGAQAYLDARKPPAPKRGQANSVTGTDMVLHIEHVSSHLHYQYERILILYIAPIHGGFTDKWVVTTDDLQLHVNADFDVAVFKCIMSRRTIPTIIQLMSRIRTLIEEKRGPDPSGVSSASHSKKEASASGLSVMPSSGTLLSKVKQPVPASNPDLRSSGAKDTAVPGRDFLNRFWMGASTLGHINIVLGEAFIVLARYNFRDPDFAQITSKRFEIIYDGSRGPSGQAVERTVVHTGGIAVKKGTAKSISQAEESMWTTSQWFAFMTSAAAKNVFGVRDTVMTLKSESFFQQPKVEYGFRTDFSGPIDIALNFGLYKYLQELVQLYQKAVAASSDTGIEEPTKGAKGRPGSPSPTNTVSPASPSPTHNNADKAANTRDAGLSPLKPDGSPATAGAAEDTARRAADIAFICTGERVFEPQLKVTGDATPWEWVEWLGVQKERVPRLVYDHVTVNTAKAVNALADLHSKLAMPIQDPSESADIGDEGSGSGGAISTQLMPSADLED
ncbi:uncharacterized protein EV422DRAFT_58087 [Fimicolochytrium jonesii]|uniref:uncharacterized protein n=1 Tax=Fimicolochytrium jonesii TaxID=1396493 RepID=UPI0022FF18A9|nr:uncharacterized protein EV422DRAFT_58087 [Fimicolochytrium jonesii]KAI8820653.1 hypothetical protein EV422DRAFT_58087 [Fimicolochytrium jonesii]